MTKRQFLSLLLAIFMVFSTITPLFAENDSVTVLPPRMAEKEEPDNIVIMEGDKNTIPTLEESGEGGKKIEETLEEPEIKEDNSPVILENREENNNIVILPPIKNEENEEGITEPSKETVEPEEPKKEKESKREVKVQILSKRDAKKPASNGEVNLVLLNDNPADINEEVYDEKIRWKESDFKIEDDKIISLSDEGLLKVARNKKLEIPEMENITIIEKEAFKGLSLRSVEIPKNIKEIKDEAFKDNHLKSVKILGKGKEISKNAFNEELVEMYGKCEKEEFLYECEDELEIGEKIVGDALGAVAPDDVSLYTFSGTTITGLSEKGKTYYTDNHNMILPGRNPQGQAITKIGGNAFSNKWRGYGLRSVDFSKCTSLTDISYNAFYNNQITNLDLSRCTHLTNIRDDAFKQNHITSLDLSKCTGLTSIGDNAFESNELTSLNLSGCKNLKSIGINAFYSNQITNLDMSGCTSLTIVRGYAFSFNQLTSIDLSECTSLTSIGWNVFRGNQLTSLDLSECTSLTSIGDNTFVSNQLKTAKIPLSLKNLADNSFKDNPGSNDKKQVYLYTPDKTNPNNLQDSDFHLINPITGPDDVSLYTFNGTTITGLSEKGKTYYTNNHNMVLPGKNPQGQAITAIGEGAFQHNRLSSLDFSRCTSLTTIGSYAFCSNFLLALDLSGCTSLTNIGHYAFRDNKLKTAKIPLSLSILSEFAFKDNPGNNYNKQVYLFTPDYTNPNNLRGSSYHLINPAEGIYDVSLYTFSGTTITGLSEKGKTYYATNHNMILPGKNPRGQAVTAIESEAFYNGRKGYGLTSVDFSYCTSLTSIGRNAFNFSQLTSLDLSKCTKLKNIGDYAFNKNKLTNLDLSRCTRLASIGEGAFCENQLTSLDLSRCTSLTNIGPGAFYQNKLTSLDLSRCTSLTSIGPTAFCRNQLTSLDLSGCTSLTSIGISAFTGSKLKTAKIPLSLATLSDDAFKENLGNNDKKQVYLYTPDYTNPNNLKDTDYHLINPVESSDDVTLYTFDGTTITGLSERGKKYYETHHDMKLPGKNPQGQDVTAIGEAAFYNKGKGYGLTSADFSNCTNLTSIGYGAFKNNKLASLNLSGCISLTSIGGDAFAGNQLSALDLSGCKNLKNIGDVAFEENQIASLDLSKCTNITSIGAYAFDGNRLKILDLSKCTSLTSIGNFAFDSNQLKTVKIPLSLKTLTDDAFKGNPGSNDKKQVYLYTPDYTNPNNLKDTSYHLINPVESSDDVTLYTFNGTTITGLSERGKKYFAEHHEMILPGKNPQGQDITAIGEEAFSNNDNGYGITSVSFSNCKSLERIDGYAFNFNKITSLNLSECTNLTSIGEAAFQENQLTSLNLSGCTSLTSIGGYAFGYNQLTKLDLSKCANLKSIGIYAFQNNQLTNLNLSGCINLLNIGNNAFQENRLTSLNLSGCTRLASIGDFAFNKNQLTSLDLTKCTNLISIGIYAFNRNQLKTSKIPLSLTTLADDAFVNNPGNNDKKQVYLYTPDYTNPNNLQDTSYHLINPVESSDDVSLYTFNGTTITGLSERGKKYYATNHDMILPWKNLKGQAITAIGSSAFYNEGKGYGLTSVDFSNCTSLKSIDYSAFMNNKLINLDLSKCTNLTSINDYAFCNNQLTSLGLSSCTNLTSIGNSAFYSNNLTALNLSECANLKSIGDYVFSSNQIANLDLSKNTNLEHIGARAFGSNKLTSLDLSKCVTLKQIGDGAFEANSLANINLSGCASLLSIGEEAFHLNMLTSLNLSGCTGLTSIGDSAFWKNKLASLDLSGCTSLTSIGNYAFNSGQNSSQLATLDLSGCINLTSIGSYSFSGNQLKTVKIPLSLKTLSDVSFSGNPGNNNKNQVYLYTPDYTNPNNLKDSDYHLINPITGPDDLSLFTFEGTTLTGLTRRGENYYAAFDAPPLTLPGKNPQGELITKIADKAFSSEDRLYLSFKGINFSNCTGLKIIGENSFARGKYGTVDLSPCTNLEVIGEFAFYFSSANTVNLSGLKKLKRIEMGAFSTFNKQNPVSNLNISGCTSLEYIGVNAFEHTKIKSLDLSDSVNLKEIGEDAFANHNIVSLNLSGLKNLTKIGMGAFRSEEGNLKSVNLSGCTGLEIIEKQAFGWAGLETIDLTPCTNLKTIEGQAFTYGKLKTVKIPLSLVNLANDAFMDNIGNNARNQVYLFTPDYTNPNNLKDSRYHLINPITGSDDVSLYTFNGTTITGLSDRGKKYFETHHEMILPGKNPQGQNVTAIGYRAFYNEGRGYGLTSVDFLSCTSLTNIGEYAFGWNQLTSINLSGCRNLTSIGGGAFYHNQLTSLDLSKCEGLTSICSNAFDSNQLTSLGLSGCINLTSIGVGAFRNNQLTSLDLSKCTSLTSICNGAFFANQLTSLDLSGCTRLTIIDSYAFENNQLTSLNLSGCTNIKNIGQEAFQHNKIIDIDFSNCSNLTSIDRYAFSYNQLTNLNLSGCTNLTDIGEHAFRNNKLTSLDLSACTNLRAIGSRAFENNQLESINLSGCVNLKNINNGAFKGNQLKDLNLSACISLVDIADFAFCDNKLINLDLSGCTSLVGISHGAFRANRLKTAKIPLSLTALAEEAFRSNPGNNASLQVFLYTPDYTNPNSLKDSDYHLINPITGSDDVTLYTFDGTKITGLSERGKKYFKENHEMVLPGKNPQGQAITAIGKKAFYNNGSGYGLTSVDFSNCTSLINIGGNAFNNNILTSVDFSDCKNLTSIGDYAFSNNRIKVIDFSGCTGLEIIDNFAFAVSKLTKLDLSSCTSLISIGKYAFGSNQLKTANIPLGLTTIKDAAFARNPGSNAKKQVYLYTPRRNNPMNLKDSDYHLVDPITFTIKKVDAKGNPMESVEFAFYKVDRPTPPAPLAPPQNGASRTDDTELEISSENISPAVSGITMPDIELNLNPEGPRPEFFPDPKTVVGVKPIFMTAITDKNGTAEITLPYSPYFLVENKTIPGYSINNTITPIDATTEGKIITYTDYEVSIEIPETGTLGTLPYILLALILVGGAYVVLRKKKEEK